MFNPFKKNPFEIYDFAKLVITEAKAAGIAESIASHRHNIRSSRRNFRASGLRQVPQLRHAWASRLQRVLRLRPAGY